MKPLLPHGVKASTTEGDVLTTVDGKSAWRPPSLTAPPSGTPEGYVPTTGADGTVAWGPAPATGSSTHREVLMASGVTPPEPLVSSDGFDWLYGEASS